MKLGMPYALNEIGGRSNQEDSVFPLKGEANESTRLFLVCDGMGGHENGEVASGLVCSTFGNNLANIDHEKFTVEMFNNTLAAAYDALDREDPNPESTRKMGTTLTFLHLNDHEVVVAHMGDSRVYHVRPSERNPILYQSSDHSLVNELVRAEIITPEEALTHPRRNVITRAMQPNLETRYPADVRTFNDVLAGDYFFLCSDGVLETITNDILVEILRRDVSDADKMEAIRELCAASSRDNFSAYLVPVVEGLPPVVHPVVSAELVEDMQPEVVERAEDGSRTTPIFATPKFDDDSKKLRLTPMNIGIASVALIAVCIAIWFAIRPQPSQPNPAPTPTSYEVSDSLKQLERDSLKQLERHSLKQLERDSVMGGKRDSLQAKNLQDTTVESHVDTAKVDAPVACPTVIESGD